MREAFGYRDAQNLTIFLRQGWDGKVKLDNFPMNPHVRLIVNLSIGRMAAWLIG